MKYKIDSALVPDWIKARIGEADVVRAKRAAKTARDLRYPGGAGQVIHTLANFVETLAGEVERCREVAANEVRFEPLVSEMDVPIAGGVALTRMAVARRMFVLGHLVVPVRSGDDSFDWVGVLTDRAKVCYGRTDWDVKGKLTS